MASSKKKAPAKKTSAKSTQSAGASRPAYDLDPVETMKQTERKGLFFKFPVGATPVRFLPQFKKGERSLFCKTTLHYTVKTEDGQRNIAPACLKVHGSGNGEDFCYICAFIDWLKETGDPMLMKVADDLFPSETLNVQAFVQDAAKEWVGPHIIGVGKKLATEMAGLLNMARDNDLPFFCDPDEGETLVIQRSGTGKFDTKYQLMQTGRRQSLDVLVPNWEKRVFRDLWAKLDVKVLSPKDQKAALYRTYRDLPWREIEKAIG